MRIVSLCSSCFAALQSKEVNNGFFHFFSCQDYLQVFGLWVGSRERTNLPPSPLILGLSERGSDLEEGDSLVSLLQCVLNFRDTFSESSISFIGYSSYTFHLTLPSVNLLDTISSVAAATQHAHLLSSCCTSR